MPIEGVRPHPAAGGTNLGKRSLTIHHATIPTVSSVDRRSAPAHVPARCRLGQHQFRHDKPCRSCSIIDRTDGQFECLGGQISQIPLPPQTIVDVKGQSIQNPLAAAISIRKRPQAPVQAFLGIHMDTVYGPDHPFQKVEQIDDGKMRGPGVADAKGGLCVMLIALEALERSPFAARIGWEVLINSDEEVGFAWLGIAPWRILRVVISLAWCLSQHLPTAHW